MATLTALATALVWTSLLAGPALVVVKVVKAHKAEQHAARLRRMATMGGPKTYRL